MEWRIHLSEDATAEMRAIVLASSKLRHSRIGIVCARSVRFLGREGLSAKPSVQESAEEDAKDFVAARQAVCPCKSDIVCTKYLASHQSRLILTCAVWAAKKRAFGFCISQHESCREIRRSIEPKSLLTSDVVRPAINPQASGRLCTSCNSCCNR